RGIDSTTARPVPGAEDAHNVFWSADSKQVAFFTQGKLKKIEITGALPQIVCEIPDLPIAHLGSWNQGKIFFTQRSASGDGLRQVSEKGGEVDYALKLDSIREETDYGPPQSLPDGKHVLFQVGSRRPEYTGAYVGSLDGGVKTRVLTTNFSPIFVPP